MLRICQVLVTIVVLAKAPRRRAQGRLPSPAGVPPRLRAIRYLAPRASPLAGQCSLGALGSWANSPALLGLKQGRLKPPFALSVSALHRLGRKLAARDTCSRDALKAARLCGRRDEKMSPGVNVRAS